ncbi:MAG: DNA polymerase III subunit delta [Rhizobiaceae bacterium]|nr:DNA polymerase III subunit delta [Rhizobiaceae bacterium]
MAQKKAHEVEAFLRRPSDNITIVLLYGPDRGLVSERATAFAAQTGLPLDDPFSVVRLEASEAEQEGRLLDEARTVPMFSNRRLLWVRNAGGQKSLAEDVKSLSADPPRDAIILMEAGELKKGAPLRAVVEGSAIGMALPCYADEDRGIDSLIDDELGKAGLAITMEARAALRRNLGGDRLASRGEIAKLALYARGKRQVDVEDVQALTGDVSAVSVDEIVDSVLDGRITDFDSAFSRFTLGGNQVYLVLAGAIRQLQSLQIMRAAVEDGRTAASVVAAARPPAFFSRRKLVERVLERASGETLQRALARLHSAVLATRRQPELSGELARLALLATAIEARRR